VGVVDVIQRTALMDRTSGRPEIRVGLIHGPVLLSHPDLASRNIQEIPGKIGATRANAPSTACRHSTFLACILSGRRGSYAPATCPDCTLLLRPIFQEAGRALGDVPSATPRELAEAIVDCVNAGARVINLSAALTQPSSKDERELEEALDHAAARGAIAVAAAGNQGTLGGSAITRHPSVIPIAACDGRGRPLGESNLGSFIGRRGLSAPGENITSLETDGKPQTIGGTSAAAPFLTGSIALVWSEFPRAFSNQIRLAVTQSALGLWRAIAPPLLNASPAYQAMRMNQPGG